ncbi:MAG: flap endonuclease-1 [Thermoprotei archaeon]|nr:MAG: flap endonuclease-1 [Thermoprotei archaeon]
MGVNIGNLLNKRKIKFEHLASKVIAIDANNMLYQFLALIRKPDGSLLTDTKGHITSHLVGLVFRITHLMVKYDIRPIFVFDGKPHILKKRALEKRREYREKALHEWQKALKEGKFDKAFSKAVASALLTRDMIADAKKVIEYMGLPIVQAPSDAEAQAAYIVAKGDAWCVCSRDYDSMLYGAPRLVRYLTISGTEFLPSLGLVKPLIPEIIILKEVLKQLKITREQLIDIAILVGTDFNEGVKGIGPKTALKLIKKYGSIEKLPYRILDRINFDYEMVRKIFLYPEVNDEYSIIFKKPEIEKLEYFLINEKNFSPKRVKTVIDRLMRLSFLRQKSIEEWVGRDG